MTFEILSQSAPVLRAMTAADAPAAGDIIYRAIARAFRDHGQPEPLADAAEGESLARLYLDLDPEGTLVAERADFRGR